MQFLIFGFESSRSRPRGRGSRWGAFASGSLIMIAALSLGADGGAAEWRLTPRLSISGGDESDLILDPNIDGAVVGAGRFVDLSPELTAVRRLGPSSDLRLSTQGIFERYSNDENRLIYAQSLSGELVHYRRNGMRTRLIVSGDFFDDSRRSTVRRLGGDVGAAVGMVKDGWGFEATGTLIGKRYPNLTTEDDAGDLGLYSESSWIVGANATVRMGQLFVRPELGYQTTESRDPLFDSNSTILGVRASLGLSPRADLFASAVTQRRSFTKRASAEDSDEFIQGGVGLDYAMMAGTSVSARVSFVRYKRPSGEDLDTNRVELGIRHSFGGGVPLLVGRASRLDELGGRSEVIEDLAPGRLRLYAPDATSVQIAGDFNGWSTTGDRLAAVGDGWWEIDLDLGPGLYQYKFVVDGSWLIPEDTRRRISDGFGSENAVLEIVSPIL
jgi:Glycogen recognition site of AMP-activated protein kinase